jgi:nuclear transport factor 2 (NTF2) superfamily protein
MNEILKPPFTQESARQKVQLAEDLWNTRSPAKVALAYTSDSSWRNRAEFVKGRSDITALLTRKWNRELNYRLKKQLFLFGGSRIAVNFVYEYHDDGGQWFRAHGIEHWEFELSGQMNSRATSINEQMIVEGQRSLR